MRTKDELIAAMNREISKLPGAVWNFSQPIEDNVGETVSGTKGSLTVKIFGNDLKLLEDKGAENPSDMTAIVLLKEKIKDVLETLTERERQVLEQRFGLVDGYSRTLEEVGRQFRVTRERIRQIEAKALRKMRHPTRIRQLEGFLEAAEA